MFFFRLLFFHGQNNLHKIIYYSEKRTQKEEVEVFEAKPLVTSLKKQTTKIRWSVFIFKFLELSVLANLRELEDDGVSDAEAQVPEVNTAVKLVVTLVVLKEETAEKKVSSLFGTKFLRDGEASSLGDDHVGGELGIVISVENSVQASSNGELVLSVVVLLKL
jgi:hypothetical protein